MSCPQALKPTSECEKLSDLYCKEQVSNSSGSDAVSKSCAVEHSKISESAPAVKMAHTVMSSVSEPSGEQENEVESSCHLEVSISATGQAEPDASKGKHQSTAEEGGMDEESISTDCERNLIPENASRSRDSVCSDTFSLLDEVENLESSDVDLARVEAETSIDSCEMDLKSPSIGEPPDSESSSASSQSSVFEYYGMDIDTESDPESSNDEQTDERKTLESPDEPASTWVDPYPAAATPDVRHLIDSLAADTPDDEQQEDSHVAPEMVDISMLAKYVDELPPDLAYAVLSSDVDNICIDIPPNSKCQVCGMSVNFACIGCCQIFYCSANCAVSSLLFLNLSLLSINYFPFHELINNYCYRLSTGTKNTMLCV